MKIMNTYRISDAATSDEVRDCQLDGSHGSGSLHQQVV